MSPERRSSCSDGTSPVLEQSNVIASTTPNDSSSHVLQQSSLPSSHHTISNQQPPPPMSVASQSHSGALNHHHYHHNLQHQQHQQLQQNNVSITSVHSESLNGHHSGLAAILTGKYTNLAPNESQSTTTAPTTTTTTMTMNSATNGSKLLVLHPNQLNDSFRASKLFIEIFLDLFSI